MFWPSTGHHQVSS